MVWQTWKRRLDEEELVVSNIAGSFLKCEYSTEQMRRELDKLRRLCDAADAFACDTIRGFCFLAPQKGAVEPERLVPGFEEAGRILAKRGKRLLLEADPIAILFQSSQQRIISYQSAARSHTYRLMPFIIHSILNMDMDHKGSDCLITIRERILPQRIKQIIPRIINGSKQNRIQQFQKGRKSLVIAGVHAADW